MSLSKLPIYENTIYSEARRYDDEHWRKRDDFKFWQNIFHKTPGSKVLELASGTGRLALPLLKMGADYTGLEISREFCKQAEQKLENYNNKAVIVQGDMRDFSIQKKFDLIFVGFNSFLHLLKDEDAFMCFNAIKRHMHSKSRFLIDIFVPNPLFLYRPENIRFPVMEYTDSISNEKIMVEESNNFDPNTEINHMTWYYSTPSKKDETVLGFTMRMYYPSKMNQLLIDAGFTIHHQWGDYNLVPLGNSSKLQIYDCGIK